MATCTSNPNYVLIKNLQNASRSYVVAFLLLTTLVYLSYQNSFQGTWVFDDTHDILENKILASFTWKEFIQTYVLDHFTRPLVELSFVLNYRIGGYDIYGYHIFNFLIHLTATYFVFLIVYKTVLLSFSDGKYAYNLALLTAAFWGTSPLHVTAVTYITQRMTSMAGMFYFMAMFFFIQGRISNQTKKAIVYYFICSIAGLAALLSKENAAMLPVTLYFYDLFIIRGASKEAVVKDAKRLIIPIAALFIFGAVYLSTTTFPLNYGVYTFTMKERLLTEPRIIWFYISLLLYPMPQRLTLDHDYTLSTSLFQPWTTAIAIIAILAAIGLALLWSRKKPLISFCIVFFFINHFIEGSFIPIEIIYEYRNYVPSLGFYLLVAMFFLWVMDYFSATRILFLMVSATLIFLLAAQTDTTYRRNTLFFSPRTLWMDNVEKAPLLSRPRINLSYFYIKSGDYKKAISEAREAVKLGRYQNRSMLAIALTNLGLLEGFYGGDVKTALKYLEEVANKFSNYPKVHGTLADLMNREGNLPRALFHVERLLTFEPNNPDGHATRSLILFNAGKDKESLKAAFDALRLTDEIVIPKMVIAEILHRRHQYDRAILFWNFYLQHVPSDRRAILALMELYYKTGRFPEAKEKLHFLLMMEKGDVKKILAMKDTNEHVYKIDASRIRPIIGELLNKQ